ncbi:hypothetical protein [Ornithinimicrobium cavernae]|uniref:hypothetical protein n=1 Tax=Ornithinimicrobium cavernae TaxID=2666047 RepID=UPI0012B16334|nr:hypothetical protein [Ornithinimicrobium cavernae]
MSEHERPEAAVPKVCTLGDSHSRFFLESKFFAGRMGYRDALPYRIEGEAIAAASVAGFRPRVSTLDVKETIRKALPRYEMAVLAFGQVDLELGFYYRVAVKKEDIDPEEYTRWLAAIYGDFLDDLDVAGKRIALKGVNLTALRPRAFAVRYVSRIVTQKASLTPRERDRVVGPVILTEAQQNRMHLSFNAKVRELAHSQGHQYFDLVAETADGADGALSATIPRLADRFLTAAFDHHLADTVPVRRMHFESVGRVFGLLA